MTMLAPQPEYQTHRRWQGPGYYNIWNRNEEHVIQYCKTKSDVKETFWDVSGCEFIRKSIPRIYAELAMEYWKGPGTYVVTQIREIAWEPDTDLICYANDVKCFADGLYRNFDLTEIVGIRKLRRGEDCSQINSFECPDTFHGFVYP